MAAVLRVKRKYTDMPMDMLVIACKRPKIGSPNSEESAPAVQTVLQFAGTLKDPTEDVAEHMAKVLPKLDKSIAVKRTADSSEPSNISAKVCKWIGVNSVVERYKVVNCQRSPETQNEAESAADPKWMTLIDVEDSWSVPHTEQEKKEDITQYEYDLYYAQTSDDVWFESNEILVQQADYPRMDSEHETASSDSNAESNWRNDYPDCDPDDASTDDAYNSDCSNEYNDDYLYGDFGGNENMPYRYSCDHLRRRLEAGQNDSFNVTLSDDEERLSGHDSDESMGIL